MSPEWHGLSVAIWLKPLSVCSHPLKAQWFIHGSGAWLSTLIIFLSPKALVKLNFVQKVTATGVGGPPGLGGGTGGTGGVGQAKCNFQQMVKGMLRLKEI